MKAKINKRTLRSEKVAYLMWGYGAVQSLTFIFSNWFPESFLLKIIFLLEEAMLVVSLVREIQNVKRFNETLAQGNIHYGKVRPLLTKRHSYEKMRTIVTEYSVVCECEGRLYDGSVVTYPTAESDDNFLEILEESEIPVLIGEDMSYVALEEMAQQHGLDTEHYFAAWLCGWLFQPLVIGIMIKMFLG